MEIFRKQKYADMEMSINTDPIIKNSIFHKLWNTLHIFVNNNKQVTNKMVQNSCFNLFFPSSVNVPSILFYSSASVLEVVLHPKALL